MAPNDTDKIVVDYPALYAAEEALARSQRNIAHTLAQLDDNLKPLLASWIGDGGEAYTAQQRKWDASSADLNATLLLVKTAVGEANAKYQAVDGKVAGAWHGTHVPS